MEKYTSGIILSNLFFADDIKGWDELWIIGDNFTAISYRKHFKQVEEKAKGTFYSMKKFEVTAFCNSRFASCNTNFLARVQNALTAALNNHSWLPKYFTIVLDDMVKYLDYDTVGVSTMYGTWLQWLAREVDGQITTRYEKLPLKVKSDFYVYWVTAP